MKRLTVRVGAALLLITGLTASGFAQWIGPVYTPEGGVTFTEPGGSDGTAMGRTGGQNWYYSNVFLANTSPMYWGLFANGVRLNFINNPGGGQLTFAPGSSSLGSGLLVWTGGTSYYYKTSPSSSGSVPVTCIVNVTDSITGAPIPLVDPATLGFDPNIGGLVPVTAAMHFKVNFEFYANGSPSLDWFDANAYGGGYARSWFEGGFYYPIKPATPSLSAVASSSVDKQIDVNWTAANNATGYSIYRLPTPITDTTGKLLATTGAVTSYTDHAADYQTYYYLIFANNMGRPGDASNVAGATSPDHIAPAAPSGLSATASGSVDKQIDLAWTASSSGDVANNLIYRSTSPISDTTGLSLAQVSAATTSYADATPAYATYYYRVFARDNSGNVSASSNQANAQSPDHIAPAPSSGLTVQASPTVDKRIDLTWAASPSADVTTYVVYRSTSPMSDTTGHHYSEVPSSTLNINDDVADYGTYYYRVFARDGSGNMSTSSNEASAASPDHLAPGPVQNLAATPSPTVDKEIGLSWNASPSPDVTAYLVYRSSSPITDTTGKQLTALSSATTSLNDVLTAYGTYYYRVYARDGAGNISVSSGDVSAVAPDHIPPAAPTSLIAIPSGSTDKGIDLTWAGPGDAVAYRVYRSDVPITDTTGKLIAVHGATPSYSDVTPAYGTYYYVVYSQDNAGNISGPSNQVNAASPDHIVPDPATLLLAVSASVRDKGIDLSWTVSGSSDATGYLIYRFDAPFTDTTGKLLTTVGKVNIFDDVTPAYLRYYYRVFARDNGGNISTPSNEANALSPDHSAPDPATLLLAASSPSQDKGIDLSWTASASTDATGYLIYRSAAPITDTTGKQIAAVGKVSAFNDVTPAYGTYYYRVFAKDDAGNISASSNEAGAVSPDHTAPMAVTGLVAAPGPRQVALRWNKSTESDFARYYVYMGTASGPTAIIDSTVAAADTTKLIAGLVNGTTYFFRITARDISGNLGPYSNEASAQPVSTYTMSLNPKSISFGSVRVSQHTDAVFSITNTGNDTLKIASLTCANPLFTIGSSGLSVAPGASVVDTAHFRPVAAHSDTAACLIVSNAITSPDTLKVTGTGLLPIMNLSLRTVAFANTNVGQRKDTAITVSNTGNDTLRITGFASNDTSFGMTATVLVVAPGQIIIDTVWFKAFDANSHAASIVIASNALTEDTIKVSGSGVIPVGLLSLARIPKVYAFSVNRTWANGNRITFRYALPKPSLVTLQVFDLKGRQVALLVNSVQPAQYYSIPWGDKRIPATPMICRIRAVSTSDQQKFQKVEMTFGLK
jgi:fibronectin type 3 domain-containing protein